MFDNLFGTGAQVSMKVDGYLERMERILKVKKMAQETNEGVLSNEMDVMLTALTNLTTIETNDAIAKWEASKKAQEEKNKVSHE